jgi:hypothetical protein
MKNKAEEINIMIYAVSNKICFLSSSIIKHGLLLLKNTDGELLKQKIITNSNSDFLTISSETKINNRQLNICIVSDEVNYEKRMIL